MKFDLKIATTLEHEITELAREIAIEYHDRILGVAFRNNNKWNDAKFREYGHSLDEMTKDMHETIQEICEYLIYLRAKIREFNHG